MNRVFSLFLLSLLALPVTVLADDNSSPQIESMMLEGGPIASHHFQSGKNNFRQAHTLAIGKVYTKDYGNWGLYYLGPNSVNRTSVGAGYVTEPYTIPLGPTKLELSGALGLVTGYQDYPVPLIAGEARWVLYDNGKLDAGLAMGALPYVMEDDTTHKNRFGIVATTPFLSLRYRFQ